MVATTLLVAGYLLAVPWTLWIPGFRRLWRRREPAAVLCAQTGAALITLGWLLQRAWPAAAVNGAWLVGFGAAYALEGRKRARQA